MIVHDVIFAIHETWPCVLELDLFPKTKSVLSFDVSDAISVHWFAISTHFCLRFVRSPASPVLAVQVNHTGFSGLHLCLVYR